MYDDYKYHSVHMKSAEFDEWTHSEGGPYYLEVGKNVDIPYRSRENVTIRTNNSNATGNPITYIEEQDVIKKYVYYEYD